MVTFREAHTGGTVFHSTQRLPNSGRHVISRTLLCALLHRTDRLQQARQGRGRICHQRFDPTQKVPKEALRVQGLLGPPGCQRGHQPGRAGNDVIPRVGGPENGGCGHRQAVRRVRCGRCKHAAPHRARGLFAIDRFFVPPSEHVLRSPKQPMPLNTFMCAPACSRCCMVPNPPPKPKNAALHRAKG